MYSWYCILFPLLSKFFKQSYGIIYVNLALAKVAEAGYSHIVASRVTKKGEYVSPQTNSGSIGQVVAALFIDLFVIVALLWVAVTLFEGVDELLNKLL